MIKDKYVVAIIPARGGSKRLKHKNIYPVLGKPMLAWGVDACKDSQYIDEVYVSSEDPEILTVAEQVGAVPLDRPQELAEDHVYKMHPVVHAAQAILDNSAFRNPDIVVVAQANSPELSSDNLDGAIEKLVNFQKQEIFSVDKELNQNAAFRVFEIDGVFQKDLSTNCGVYITDDYDIHTKEDVDIVEKRMQHE